MFGSGMNYELTLGGRATQRKRGHLWGTDACTPPYDSPAPHSLRHTKQDQQIVINCHFTQCKTEQDMCETQTFRFSLMFQPHCCSAVSSCQSSRVTCRLVLPHFSEMPGSAAGFYPVICLRRGLVFTALLLIMELGERATPTH